ncbi:VCBS repeat-containing protein [Pontimicrobium sp. MEBiC01747]
MMKLLHKYRLLKHFCYLFLIVILLSRCSNTEKKTISKTLFERVDSKHTNVQFSNTVKEDLYFNFLNYSYIYNGGGVASGDVNNDGLEDLYFTANQHSNKLYLNKGNFKFEDITDKANVEDKEGWTTGVTMIDINNDGWLDIYVCKSGALNNHEKRKNKLFINQKNNSFKESAAQYGLDFYGFSIQSYFFDMDNDGDLDMYLVNHRADFRNNTSLDLVKDKQIEDYASDQLFKNENGKYINVTNSSGIANKAWGLSASIGDFNNDGWADVFVANDFLQPDYLYLNNKNGTFTDRSLTTFNHLSNNSMGSDFEDVNNDLKSDLLVLDMLAEDHIRSKKNMATMSTSNFNKLVDAGYHYQYMSNTLQLNNGNGSFSEIAQLAGVAKTDWSWAPLIADFDNDGLKDVFVTNGITNDLSNQDFRNQMRQNIMNRKKVSLEEAIIMMPSNKLQNYAYKNNGDLTFSKMSNAWGFKDKINSNGVVYSDLDNDGDLDLVVNNQEEEAHIYRNNTSNNFISFKLKGSEQNKDGIGSEINIYAKNLQQSKTLYVSRGYQSSVTNKVHFGLGNITTIDSVLIKWPDQSVQRLTNIKVNQTLRVDYMPDKFDNSIKETHAPSLFKSIDPTKIGIHYKQKENTYNDFNLQLLLPQKQSEISSPLAVADVNNDGLDDLFIGNAKGAEAELYIQKSDATFIKISEQTFNKDKDFEDTDAKFIDIDNDNDLDLYVTSGGYEFEENSPFLQDRLYINDGTGHFTKSNALPNLRVNSSSIAVSDYDEDGDLDIFVGVRVVHGKYPLSNQSYLLENKNGTLIEVTNEIMDHVSDLRIVNDAVFSDYDNDGDKDLLVVGEWMPIIVYENDDKKFRKKEIKALKNTNGWYNTIQEIDINNDGNVDYVLGNLGINNKFHPTIEKPLHIYADNFDANNTFDIALSKVSKTGALIPVRGKECSSQQTPYINNKLKSYKEFAVATMPEIYGQDKLKNATHYKASTFESLILINNGAGTFTKQNLPNRAQLGPTLGVESIDVNNDGFLDILGVGSIYEAEVETIRYDASKGYIVLGGNKGELKWYRDRSFFNEGEAKAIKQILINNEVHFIILNKNSSLKMLKINK